MLETILTLGSSSVVGAVIGAVGGYLAKKEQRKLDEMNNAHEVAMTSLDMQSDAAEAEQALAMADKQIDIAHAESEIASEVAAGEAFTASQIAANKSSGVPFVDGIRSLMRPLITAYLLIVTTFLTYNISELIGGLNSIPVADLYELYQHIINQLIFLTVTAVSWWFASRGSKRG